MSERGDGGGADTTVDVVVVGAGAAGLACAAALDAAGLAVVVLEARERVGGRVLTLRPPGAPLPVELGAEFVHGTPPALLEILERAGVDRVEIEDARWRSDPDGVRPVPHYEDDVEAVFEGLDDDGAADRPFDAYLADWMARHPGRDRAARRAREYVEGFHAADARRVGVRALAHEARAEREEGGDEHAFRLPAGYDRAVAALRARLSARAAVRTGAIVTDVRWEPGRVRVTGSGFGDVVARSAVLTLPVGVLAAAPGERGAVRLSPPVAAKDGAVAALAMGAARRVVLHFRDAVWREAARAPGVRESLDRIGFLQAPRAAVPVWWTPAPLDAPMMVGWLGGPRAAALAGRPDDEVQDLALGALAGALHLPRERLARSLAGAWTCDWGADPFARGAYSYALAGAGDARRRLAEPVEGTLFWAGEATNWPGSAGTVHGAIASGYRAAGEVVGQGARALGR